MDLPSFILLFVKKSKFESGGPGAGLQAPWTAPIAPYGPGMLPGKPPSVAGRREAAAATLGTRGLPHCRLPVHRPRAAERPKSTKMSKNHDFSKIYIFFIFCSASIPGAWDHSDASGGTPRASQRSLAVGIEPHAALVRRAYPHKKSKINENHQNS